MRKAVAVVALLASSASAEPPGLVIPMPLQQPVLAEAPIIEQQRSYRWQVIASDLAATGALAYSLSYSNDEWAYAGLAAFSFGAPIAHAANGHGARAVASLALRAGTPILFALAGSHLDDRAMSCSDCSGVATTERKGFYEGLVAGAVVAMVVDAALLAKPQTRVRRGWSPTASALRGGGTIGVAGNF